MYHPPSTLASAPTSVALPTGVPRPPEESQDAATVLRQTFGPFRRRWRLFAGIVVGFVLLVGVFTMLWPRSYTATTKLIAGTPQAANAGPQQAAGTELPVLNALLLANGQQQTAETYAELFKQFPVAQTVADTLKLGVSPDRLLSAVKVTPVNNTSILNVSATWSDRDTAARIANGFASAFVARERELITAQATSAIGFLSQQLPAAENRLHQAEGALAQFESANHIADVNAQTQSTVSAAAAIDAKIDSVELDRRQAQAQVDSLQKQLGGMSATTNGGQTVQPNPVLAQLRTQLAQQQVALATARQQYTDEHPTVVAARNQIAELQREIAQQPPTIVASSASIANPVYQQISQQLAIARSQANASQAQLAQLQQQRARIEPQIAALPATTAKLSALQRQQKLAEAVYTALQQKLNDAQVTKTTALSDVNVTQAATPHEASVRPNLELNLIVALVLGLVLGAVGVYVADMRDNTVREAADVEREFSLPVLGSLPVLPAPDVEPTPELTYLVTESYLQLVTAMRYASDKPLRTIAITSPSKGDGKSTIALGIGKALGELASGATPAIADGSKRVLVIDADLRRPTLHEKLGTRNERGLSDVLVGRARFADSVRSTKYPGLDVLSSGTPSPNPIKLLQSQRFDDLLAEAAQTYATVILDAPAIVPVFDGAVIAAKADGTVFVVAAGRTDTKQTRLALQRLAQVGVRDFIGTVLNRAPSTMHDYSDYFGFTGNEQPALAAESA